MTTSLRRILLIAYHFPPSPAVGGLRMTNFAKGLSASGWGPQVLTIRDEDLAGGADLGRMKSVEGIPIRKVRVLPTISGVYAALRKRWNAAGPQAPASAAPVRAGTPALERESLLRRARRYILSFLSLPDYERGWILPAVIAAAGEIRRHRIGWLVTSGPPYSEHLIGLAVKLITGARWVADFRDPWMTTGSKRVYPTCGASIAIERWLEKKVIQHADLVLFNVARLRDAYRSRYNRVAAEKFVFIPNGIPSRLTGERAAVSKYPVFTLSYTGSLYVGRTPEPVCQAISRLIRDGRIDPGAIRMKLVGPCREMDGVPTSSVIRKYGLESVVELLDSVPYQQALEIISRSHLALLFAPNLPFQIPAKVYDYFAAGTRILAIAEEGGTADLIRETGSGRAFSSDDIDGIAEFIYQEMTSRSGNDMVPSTLDRFRVGRITEELVGHLGRVTAASNGARSW